MLGGFQCGQRGEFNLVVHLDGLLLEVEDAVTQGGVQRVVPFELVFQVMDFVVEHGLSRDGALSTSSPVGEVILPDIEADVTFVGPALWLLVFCKRCDA